jgi:hypothetical protein
MKLNLLLLFAIAGAALYILALRRQLETARMRGDMYREISTRLDRRVAELASGGTQ